MSSRYKIYYDHTCGAERSHSPCHFGDSKKTDNNNINHQSNHEERGRDGHWVSLGDGLRNHPSTVPLLPPAELHGAPSLTLDGYGF